MTTLGELITEIQRIMQDNDAYPPDVLIPKINETVTMIAAGVRMPDGMTSPPLPELFDSDTVDTATDAAYVSLPTDYQRNLHMVADDSGDRLACPTGGDYYSFRLFLNRILEKDLTESGSIYLVCVKGLRLYYQGIPTASETLTLHFYRKPVDMAANDDTPDGIPDHLQMRLVKHGVCKELFGEAIEDGENSSGRGMQYHSGKFYEAMTELIDYVGIDEEPIYFHTTRNRYPDDF
jgi:hypothetical protein